MTKLYSKATSVIIDKLSGVKGAARLNALMCDEEARTEFVYEVFLELRKYDWADLSENAIKRLIRETLNEKINDVMKGNKTYKLAEVKKGVFIEIPEQ